MDGTLVAETLTQAVYGRAELILSVPSGMGLEKVKKSISDTYGQVFDFRVPHLAPRTGGLRTVSAEIKWDFGRDISDSLLVDGVRLFCSHSVNPTRYGGSLAMEDLKWVCLAMGLQFC